MSRERHTPYTQRGIRRVRCSFKGCRRRGYASWQVCADARVFRALCWVHDIALNRLVLEWVGDKDIERKMARYAARVIRAVHAGRAA
jgi:hypothetical protein